MSECQIDEVNIKTRQLAVSADKINALINNKMIITNGLMMRDTCSQWLKIHIKKSADV